MKNKSPLSRRKLIGYAAGAAGASLLPLPAFAQRRSLLANRPSREERIAEMEAYVRMYGALPNERFPIPAVNLRVIDPVYLRKFGTYQTNERPGTVIVDTAQKVLFLTMPDNKAVRYGIGIGRAGFEWSGRAVIKFKRQWPTWTPPAAMIEREPELEEWRNGMPPGLGNPLGARALYIFQNGKDTLYRLHGSSEEHSIGRAVSSGCVRLLQQDVIDLYNRVPNNTPIVVI